MAERVRIPPRLTDRATRDVARGCRRSYASRTRPMAMRERAPFSWRRVTGCDSELPDSRSQLAEFHHTLIVTVPGIPARRH